MGNIEHRLDVHDSDELRQRVRGTSGRYNKHVIFVRLSADDQ